MTLHSNYVIRTTTTCCETGCCCRSTPLLPSNDTCLCKRSSRRSERLCLPLHLTAEMTDTCLPSLYINLLLAQIDNMNQSFLCALWLRSSHKQHNTFKRLARKMIKLPRKTRWNGWFIMITDAFQTRPAIAIMINQFELLQRFRFTSDDWNIL
jgi:hypothetical protein